MRIQKQLTLMLAKQLRCEDIDELGITLSGVKETALAIISDQTNTQFPHPSSYNIKMFSLQDAIDFAEFLIRTTIDCQRFSVMIPNVGGDIDIALVTPFNGFQWIRQKQIGAFLEEK